MVSRHYPVQNLSRKSQYKKGKAYLPKGCTKMEAKLYQAVESQPFWQNVLQIKPIASQVNLQSPLPACI